MSKHNAQTFELPQFEDGTNLPLGTRYLVAERGRSPWYVPSESSPTPRWREKLLRIQSQFDEIARLCRPRPVMLVQYRQPGRDIKFDPLDSVGGERQMLSYGTALGRGCSPLAGSNGYQLFSDFPIADAEGKPICNAAGSGYAMRYGLSRSHIQYAGPNYVHENRPQAGPQLSDVAREASGILYGLPPAISTVLWKNWRTGFHQEIREFIWIDALFEMAWQKRKDSSLTGERFTLIDRQSYQLEDEGLFPRIPACLLDRKAMKNFIHEYGCPAVYYSKLDDIARASVSLIDVLLELPEQETKELLPANDTPVSAVLETGTAPSSAPSTSIDTKEDTCVFISYSHKDKQFLNQLMAHLKPFTRMKRITPWSDQQIAPGSKWLGEIKSARSKTKVAVFLVSPAFLNSDFIHHEEVIPLFKAAGVGGVKILWILVRDCSWKMTCFSEYQAVVSPPGKALAQMKAERDTAWTKICEEIEKAFNL